MKQYETIKFNKVSSERHLDLNKLMLETFVEKKKVVKKKQIRNRLKND